MADFLLWLTWDPSGGGDANPYPLPPQKNRRNLSRAGTSSGQATRINEVERFDALDEDLKKMSLASPELR